MKKEEEGFFLKEFLNQPIGMPALELIEPMRITKWVEFVRILAHEWL